MQVKRFLTAPGCEIVADVGGERADEAVVLLHGGGESRHVMAPLARLLVADGRYVINIDLRGHGESGWAADADYSVAAYAADVASVLSELGVRPTLIGRKLGGLVATAVIERAEPPCAAAVLIDAGPVPPDAFQGVRAVFGASQSYADLSEAIEVLAGTRPILAAENLLRRLLVVQADGRMHWKHDPAILDLENPRRMSMQADSAAATARIGAYEGPLLLIRPVGHPSLSAESARELAAENPRLEFRDLAQEVPSPASVNDVIREFLDRVAPLPPDRPTRDGVDPLTLRQAMGSFATGVAIITTTDTNGTPIGLTANSLCSVSLDPPLILFCLDRKVSSLGPFEQAAGFAVNILHSGQADLSERFARKGEDRFRELAWEAWENGAPIIQDSLASLECDRQAVVDGGDHRIFIGRVRNVWMDPAQAPLLFFQGKYRMLNQAE
jgi:flavin reductase (DIM6/NTAB) family NADH-FMN oxidoreductase RutF/pimeloyl-ACP methyl ester carboxylesterase